MGKCNLNNTNLSNTILEGANLLESILFETNFSGAYFTNARLEKVDLRNAIFTGVNTISVQPAGENLSEQLATLLRLLKLVEQLNS